MGMPPVKYLCSDKTSVMEVELCGVNTFDKLVISIGLNLIQSPLFSGDITENRTLASL